MFAGIVMPAVFYQKSIFKKSETVFVCLTRQGSGMPLALSLVLSSQLSDQYNSKPLLLNRLFCNTFIKTNGGREYWCTQSPDRAAGHQPKHYYVPKQTWILSAEWYGWYLWFISGMPHARIQGGFLCKHFWLPSAAIVAKQSGILAKGALIVQCQKELRSSIGLWGFSFTAILQFKQ